MSKRKGTPKAAAVGTDAAYNAFREAICITECDGLNHVSVARVAAASQALLNALDNERDAQISADAKTLENAYESAAAQSSDVDMYWRAVVIAARKLYVK